MSLGILPLVLIPVLGTAGGWLIKKAYDNYEEGMQAYEAWKGTVPPPGMPPGGGAAGANEDPAKRAEWLKHVFDAYQETPPGEEPKDSSDLVWVAVGLGLLGLVFVVKR